MGSECRHIYRDNLNLSEEEQGDPKKILDALEKYFKPSRITSTSATLIDNIFLNVIDKNINTGLAITDITDHLPVFVTYNCQIKSNASKHARLRIEKAINMFRNDY